MRRLISPTLQFCLLFFLLSLSNAVQGTAPIPVQLSIPFSNHLGPNTVIVPFTSLGRLIIIKAKVNGRKGNFILDTGANGLVLNELHFQADHMIRNTVAYGLSGAVKQVGVLKTDSLNIDELRFDDTKAQIINLNPIELKKNTRILGLIGYDILKEFEIMFQYRQRFLTFSRVTPAGDVIDPLPHTLDKQDSLNFVLGNHIPVIEVKVGGKVKKMGIDSGAEYNLLNKRRSRNILEHFEIKKKIKVTSTDQQDVEVLAGRLSKVFLKDRYPCGAMSTLLVNFKQLNRIYGMRLDGILGYQFLAPWVFSINYRKKKLFLHKIKFNKP